MFRQLIAAGRVPYVCRCKRRALPPDAPRAASSGGHTHHYLAIFDKCTGYSKTSITAIGAAHASCCAGLVHAGGERPVGVSYLAFGSLGSPGCFFPRAFGFVVEVFTTGVKAPCFF
jgi:hypothetical protein